MTVPAHALPVLVAGGSIGEIGAGIQLGPNAFAAVDALGLGEPARSRAVATDEMVMPDALDETLVACMALEDSVTLGEASRVSGHDFTRAFALYERSRIARTARLVLSARERGRLFHAEGVERLVRSDVWNVRTPERFYDAMEWLYGWRPENCLAA